MGKRKVTVVVDLQFGSTGKGAIVGKLATEGNYKTAITAWGPNAGHTFIDSKEGKFVHRQLAISAVSPKVRTVMIAPGSVVDIDVLLKEVSNPLLWESRQNTPLRVLIHENAAVLNEDHVAREDKDQAMVAIGSTRKGTWACQAEKASRDPGSNVIAKHSSKLEGSILFGRYHGDDLVSFSVVGTEEWLAAIRDGGDIMVEGAQGFSLGLNAGMWPYVTSRECSVAQVCSDCLISPAIVNDIVGVARTFPIRVANRYDKDGNMVGTSGPGYPDQRELSWEYLGVPPEKTTVTKLERRVFSWSRKQIKQAVEVNAPGRVFLNFANYVKDDKMLAGMVADINRYAAKFGGRVHWLGYGPGIDEIADVAYQTRIENNPENAVTLARGIGCLTDAFLEFLATGPRAEAVSAGQVSVKSVMAAVSTWADEAFPERTDSGIMLKLMEELGEVVGSSFDHSEFADVFILLFDLAHRRGVNVVAEVAAKLEQNRKRTWEKDPKLGVMKHTKGGK